jgi:BirA family biotin operon repressor/biotin-[acetyl-CoA-carboxylase] ligase
VLVAPTLPLDRALWLSLATGLAAQAAVLKTCGVALDIRWPNDLMVGERKCGGILVETSVDAGNLRYAVIGVGINVQHASFPAELAEVATSLRIASETSDSPDAPDATALLTELLRALDLELTLLENGDDSLLARFTASSTWVRGKRVRVDEAGGYTGVTAGLNAAGFLQVDDGDGRTRTVLSGGVRAA